MPSRSAISIRVSPGNALISWPFNKNVTVGASASRRISRVVALMLALSTQLIGKVFDDRVHGIWRCLTQSADRRIAHHLREFGKQRLVPVLHGYQHVCLSGAHPARSALAAGLVFKKT